MFEWHHPVHEVLRRTDGARTWKTVTCSEIVLEHHPDPTKSRGSYLPLLRMSVQEDPEDDRNAHYLGRELMFHGLYTEAIAALKHHLEMPRAVWRPERVCLHALHLQVLPGVGGQAAGHGVGAAGRRGGAGAAEPWVQAQEAAYASRDWEGVVYYGLRATAITEKSGSYINEDKAWGPYPWDAMAYAYYQLGELAQAHRARRDRPVPGAGRSPAAGEHAVL